MPRMIKRSCYHEHVQTVLSVWSAKSAKEEKSLKLKDKIELQDTDDEGQIDVESDDDSSDDEDEEDDDINAGDVVWGMCSRMWYPAKNCSLTDVPENIRNLFRNNRQKLILKWYAENKY